MPHARSRLYRRKNSPYWWLEYTARDGTTRAESTRCTDRAAAEVVRADKEMQRVRSDAGIPVAKPIAIASAAAEYLAEREKVWTTGNKRGKGWYATVEAMFRHQIVPFFKPDRIVSTITRPEVAKFRIEQIRRPSRTGRRTKVVGSATVNRTMAALATFGTWCEERHYVIANSACPNPFTKHKPLDEPELAVTDPAEEQVATFLSALGERWVAASVILADTGLRKSELERLERRNLNLEDGKATVTNTKNRKKARTVFLTPRAIAALRRLPERLDGLVFGPLGDQRRAFRKAAKTAGFAKVRLHDLRHFFATRLLRSGADIREVMAAGGWTTLRMVQRYTHVGENRLRQATARLAAAQQQLEPAAGPTPAPSASPTDTPRTH